MAWSLHLMEKHEQAIEAIEVGLRVGPEFFTLHLVKAQVLLALEQNDAALRSAKEALRISADDVDATLALADAYFAQEHYRAAADACDRAIVLSPSNAIAFERKGRALMYLHEFAGAEKVLREALALEPNSPTALANLGLVLQKANEARALELYQDALNLDPSLGVTKRNTLALLRKKFEHVPLRVWLLMGAGLGAGALLTSALMLQLLVSAPCVAVIAAVLLQWLLCRPLWLAALMLVLLALLQPFKLLAWWRRRRLLRTQQPALYDLWQKLEQDEKRREI